MIAAAVLLLQTAIRTGEFENPRLRESSGVAVSRTHAGVLWTHNDSGDGPYVYATDLRGQNRGALRVSGAEAIDWEDLALGPCPRPAPSARDCLYLADTGDNLERRPWVTVYAVPEPAPPAGPLDTARATLAPEVLRLRYPDGAHDVEGVFVTPADTALHLVTKGRSGTIRIYRVSRGAWDRAASEIATAALVQTLDIRPNAEAGRQVTGAAVRRDGGLVAVRTYTEIYLLQPTDGGRLVPARARPCDIDGLEFGGEAVAFLNDSTLVLTSEASWRRRGSIHTTTCPRFATGGSR